VVAHGMDETADAEFEFGVLGPDTTHVFAALLGREGTWSHGSHYTAFFSDGGRRFLVVVDVGCHTPLAKIRCVPVTCA